jgi:uroporphyrinogen decarboxylase
MMRAANRMKAHFGPAVDLVEYKLVRRENLARAAALGVRNVPAVLVNGTMAFSSIIPSQPDFVAAVDAAAAGRATGAREAAA